MSHPPFDPSRAVTFDLAHGQVHLEDAPRRVLVPAEALLSLSAQAGDDALRALARALGEPMGRRLSRRLGEMKAATISAVVEHLGGELALLGLGSLALERWGRALVLVVDQSPFGEEGDVLLAATVEAALAQATGRELGCVVLDRDEARVRFLVVNPSSAKEAREWLEEGQSWGDVLVRLHEGDRPRGEA